MFFEILHKSKISSARVGKIHTAHGIVDTPNFVPVGTNGSLKAIPNDMLNDLDVQLMFSNTYHLYIQPGREIIKNAGGLHKFSNRNRPFITDSGGFQIFSLMYGSVNDELKSRGNKKTNQSLIKVSEAGALFRSYRDGAKIMLTPEISVDSQKDFGADIIIPLDELLPFHCDENKMYASLHRTHRWEKRSLDQHKKNPLHQKMYAVVHGGISEKLRKFSAETLSKMDFDGYAIGGSLGKTREQMYETVSYTTKYTPEHLPRHLLGIADIHSPEKLIQCGIDTFDSTYPTKAARHGSIFTKKGSIKITKSEYASMYTPIEEDCSCSTCRNGYTLAYLNHLFKASEPVAGILASIHNVKHMLDLMKKFREQIADGHL